MITLRFAPKPPGFAAQIHALWQESTYAGLIEGYPFARLNASIVEGVARTAAVHFPGQPFALARPVITRFDEPSGAFGPREELPRIMCIGLARDVEGDELITMALGWFQDVPAPPIPPAVVEELERIDFFKLAKRELY